MTTAVASDGRRPGERRTFTVDDVAVGSISDRQLVMDGEEERAGSNGIHRFGEKVHSICQMNVKQGCL